MSEKKGKYVLWFDEIGMEDVPLVGGKSASLGEMTRRTGVPVPYGFATTAEAYRHYIKVNGLDEKIAEALKELKDPNDTATLQKVGAKIRKMIATAKMPEEIEKEIVKAYKQLAKRIGEEDPFVAVRSSATAEDLPDASFAGQQETYLNVHTPEMVVEKIKECFASLFTDRAIFYRIQKGFDHMAVALSSIVQLMVYSKASGVIFTLDVASGDKSVVLIEAGYGLGEFIVQGTITPDEYYVRKSDLEIVKKNVPTKTVQLVRLPKGGTEKQPVPPELQNKQVLTDEQIKELAKYAIAIEEHYKKPMDIEWALDERTNKLFILQARPETVWALKAAAEAKPAEIVPTKERKVLVQGLPASPGIAVGKVHIIPTVDKINEFQKGEILVTEMTAPDWVPAMRKAAAIVTNSGGMTCHAAIVSRELGIPCIVGTSSKGKPATEYLPDGAMVTVDAKLGVVYEGVLEEVSEARAAPTAAVAVAEPYVVTGTKIYVNLGEPEIAEKVAALPADGVGLLRQEFVWTSEIGEHPLYLIETGHPEKVVNGLAEAFRKICAAFYPRPVIMRFSDFKSSEYRELKGGDKYEPIEPSALMGWRGASRYYDPKYVEAFKLEVQAVKKVREEFGLKNLWVMIPFCRTPEEMEKINQIFEEQGLKRGPDFKVWLMAEIPSNCLIADKFNKYVDGYSIGSNDLTMTVLGCDRDNENVAHLFDERNLAVKRAIRLLIKLAHRDGKTVSICGQAPSVYPEFTEFLVRSGIDSISVNPDVVVSTRKLVAMIEQKILLEKATGKGPREDPDLDIPLDDSE
ncbi:MAG: phosphoenolpyruvate synthase [Nitrososphaerota archaeon]|nr:phosphoenolpyruvate synthase [Candidatus Bathyarchaeota archaeon]MDW8048093.1 phosphoenolpyruvate synthase [Nitrososphaerota archaeon]